MKKREITNNELEQLFNTVIEQTPLLNEEQVNSFLNNLPQPSLGNAFKSFFQNHLNTLLLSSGVVLIITSALIWINSAQQSNDSTVQNNPVQKLVAPVVTDTIEVEPANIIEKEIIQNKADEKAVLKDSVIKTDAKVVPVEKTISLADIYKLFDKMPEVFSIQADRDTTIICNEGTMIKIDANSFVAKKNGSEITGNVRVEVKEYYKMSDIILSNLTTTSGDKILETGGMIHISAAADNENCMIKPGKNIEIGFPYSNTKEDMALFYGEQTINKIDWKLANRADDVVILEGPNVFFIVEDMPEFPGGDQALRRYISENLKYPVDAAENGITGKVYVTFIVGKDGSISNASIARGVHPSLDREAIRVVNSLPNWKPGKQRGKPVNVSYTVPVNFDPENLILKKEFEKKTKSGNFKNTTVSDVNKYLFSSTQLGWINCDRFYRKNVSITNYSILIEEPEKPIVNLIFHSFKAILPGYIESNRIVYNRVPLGEKVTIVALKTVDNKILLAVKETVITDKVETELDFQQVSLDLLKKEMEKLNKYY